MDSLSLYPIENDLCQAPSVEEVPQTLAQQIDPIIQTTLPYFLEQFRQACERLWLLTSWFYHHDGESPQLAVFRNPNRQGNWTVAFTPMLLYYEAVSQATTDPYITLYPFAEYRLEYQRWCFLEPEQNETVSRNCHYCHGGIIHGYSCYACLRKGQPVYVCTMCSQNEVHEQAHRDHLHTPRLTFTKHCGMITLPKSKCLEIS